MRHKGTVFESGDNWAILLMPGGEFKKVKTKGRLHIGQMYAPVVRAAYRPVVAAAVLIITLALSVNFLTVAAWARLSPGVELGVNSWGRVVSIKIQGGLGQNLTVGMPMWGKRVEEVLPGLLERTMQQIGNAQQENIVIKVEAQGKYWPRGQSGLAHINQSLHKYNEDNSQGRLVNQDDPQSWLWQKYNQPAGEDGQEQSDESKKTGNNEQGTGKEKPKTDNQPGAENEKGGHNTNNNNSGVNSMHDNDNSNNNSTINGNDDKNNNPGNTDSSEKQSPSSSHGNNDNNGNGSSSNNDSNGSGNNGNNSDNNGNGSKHANKSQPSEKERQKNRD
ncbi:MAG: hypothetical protein ABFD04_11430 [Syntrophomonas sp.]